jgi:hypothetical protein
MLQRKKWQNGWKNFGKTGTKNKKLTFFHFGIKGSSRLKIYFVMRSAFLSVKCFVSPSKKIGQTKN